MSAQYGVAQIFLSKDQPKAAAARKTVDTILAEHGLRSAGWRVVPTDTAYCGEIALASLPSIEQLFINTEETDEQALATQLYIVRRKIELALANDEDFYISSFSASVISYKGLVMPVDLPKFYSDLADPRLETAICVFHQRFSTNTLPRWPLAQPFLLAHNGEINTIEGNRN